MVGDVTRYAQLERGALADLCTDLGPDAPTLCAGWSTRDLAAHLVLRERRPDAAAGMFVSQLRGRTERVQHGLAALPYPQLIAQVRAAPWWSPLSNPLLDSVANTMEFFIHHEDVRRAQPGWRPRELPDGQCADLWKRTAMLSRLALRRFPAAVLLRAPGLGERTAGAGGELVRATGTPAELVLFLSGRQAHARVQVEGPAQLVERLRSADLGL